LYSFTISVHLISGLIREVTFLEGDILYYFTISVHLISGLIRWVTSLEGDILYYFTISVPLISDLWWKWPHKRGTIVQLTHISKCSFKCKIYWRTEEIF
jgi:hypothetical protein